MFANFNEIMKPEKAMKIPHEIINQLNKKLPKGFEYVQIDENACGISSKNDLVISLNVLLPELPENIKDKIKNINDMFEYLYRTQKKVVCQPNTDNTITINGTKIPISNFITFPFSDKQLAELSNFTIVPQQFSDIGEVLFQAGEIKKLIKLKRVPHESMDTILIESQEDTWLSVKIIIHEEDILSSSINFSFRLENIKSCPERISAYKFYNSLFSGDIFIAGQKLGNIKNGKQISLKVIDFWEKVKKIEESLGLSFDCSTPVKKNDAYELETLFISLIKNKAYREDINVNSDTGLYFSEESDLQNHIGNELAISYIQELQWNILRQEFVTFSVVVIYNAIIESINKVSPTKKDKKFFIRLKSVEGKTMYQSIKIFKTKKEAEGFLTATKNDFNIISTIMHNSEKIII